MSIAMIVGLLATGARAGGYGSGSAQSIHTDTPRGLPHRVDLPISGAWARVRGKYVLTGTFDTNAMSFATLAATIKSNDWSGVAFEWFTIGLYVPGGTETYLLSRMKANRKVTKFLTVGTGPKCRIQADRTTGRIVCTVKLKARWLVEDYGSDQVDLNTYCMGFSLTPYGW